MKYNILVLAAALLLWNFQCAKDEESPTSSEFFELGKPFDVQFGTNYTESAGALSLQLNNVISDSRCAKDVDCVWAGSTEAALFFYDNTHQQTDTLSSNHYGGWTDSTTFQGYKIKFVGVAPEAISNQEIPLADYRLKLVVTK